MRKGSMAEETEWGHILSERVGSIKGINLYYKHKRIQNKNQMFQNYNILQYIFRDQLPTQ